MVALMIAGLAVAVVLRGVTGGMTAAHLTSQYQQALARARSHLAGIGQPRPVDQDGDDGSGFRWRLHMSPVETTAGGGADRLTLYSVSVTISWQAGDARRAVRLDSMRIGPPPGGGA